MAYAIMMEKDQLTRPVAYLNGPTIENSGQADFVFANNLFLSYLNDRNEFVLDNDTKETIRTKAMAANELSDYARSIYFAFTGERLRIPLLHTQHVGPRASNYNHLAEGKITSYPNLVTGNEHIVYINTNFYDQKYVINIRDMMSRIVKSENSDHGENVFTDLKSDMYIVHVQLKSGKIIKQKIIIH